MANIGRTKKTRKVSATTKVKQERRDDLIREYSGYVEKVVARLMKTRSLPRKLHDEFIAAGYLGLVEAADRFDFSSGKDFRQFAFLRVRGAVIDSIRAISDSSGKAYKQVKALQAAHSIREELAHHWDTSEQQSSKTAAKDVHAQKLGQILDFAAQAVMAFRLDVDVADAEISDALGGSESPEARLVRLQRSKVMKSLVRKLPQKERRVIQEFYYREKNLLEVARDNKDLSKSWISRLHQRGLSQLKAGYLSYLRKESAGDEVPSTAPQQTL